MVKSNIIIQSNHHFPSQHRGDEIVVGVFAGATSGIGARTLERMTTMFRSPTFYFFGRSSSRFAACEQIKATETKVNYLCVSMGGLPLTGVNLNTKEGLETCFTPSYTARLRLLLNLLELLNRSARPRVLSVLSGGKEKHISEEEVGLKKSWSVFSVVNQTTLFTRLVFGDLAAQNPNLTLIHNASGLVESDNIRSAKLPADTPTLRRVYLGIINLPFAVLRFCIGMSPRGPAKGKRITSQATCTVRGHYKSTPLVMWSQVTGS